ncbi:hypothetical protein BB561_002606 [Smittium simulii]|uniref:Uncharacterized protein n=1 Tax=Smittium simulii TaxID=133385 RepID=A0A2T9YPV6_9FUNG|nr:hypothetical protein BB561_002606 [Smittium simulii]
MSRIVCGSACKPFFKSPSPFNAHSFKPNIIFASNSSLRTYLYRDLSTLSSLKCAFIPKLSEKKTITTGFYIKTTNTRQLNSYSFLANNHASGLKAFQGFRNNKNLMLSLSKKFSSGNPLPNTGVAREVTLDYSGKQEKEYINSPIVGYWLLYCASMCFGIIVWGGLTRLTESGLSIVEWAPISGVKLPTTESEWEAEFDKYKLFPEYQK